MATAQFRYEAFLSYSHADARWANWLHRAIETYRIPKRLVVDGAMPRLSPIFRDREELPSASDLGRKIEEALTASRRLIVICSPRAAQSRWVNEEIARFKALGRGEQIYCLIVEGEPHALQRGVAAESECFPPALLVGDGMSEPLAADVRDGGDGKNHAKLKVIAGMLGVGLDELRRRELQRRNRRLAWISTAALVGIIGTSMLAAYALIARNEADASRLRAQRDAETARQTTKFLVGLFDVVDPSEARGRSVTAYEILERGVGSIHRDLDDQPEVQATLLQTMGKVFTGLGLYKRATQLLMESMQVQPDPSTPAATSVAVALGDALYLDGNYDAAEQRYRATEVALGQRPWDFDQTGVANGIADVLTQKGDYIAAIAKYRATLDLDIATWGDEDIHAARTLNGLATAQLYSGDNNDAAVSYERSLKAYRAAVGPDHPKVAELINNLGAVRYFNGDNAGAADYWRSALPMYRKLYGNEHPELSMILNNLGRAELESRHVEMAVPLLEESVAIDRKLGRSEHDDLVFALNSLALAYRERGDLEGAERLLIEASTLAARTEHRMLGPVLVNQVDFRCSRGDAAGTTVILDDADTRIRHEYPDEPWRIAILESVRGLCLAASGNAVAGRELMLEALPVIESRWGKDSLFSHDAQKRLDSEHPHPSVVTH